ncbi:hypothetical protein [Arthrobacter sp. ISL-5]|uniref:hypothetical protein n=1 Tax=Arthrobacter sp. ISL-5 TaxID=2819111 RepID=UPI001BE758E6|nr:hypothetical protein [Arthrobacter sp. ISL-5]
MGYNLAGVVGGGIVPLVAAQLAGTSGAWSIGFLLAGIGVFSVFCTLALPNREKRGLEEGKANTTLEYAASSGGPEPTSGLYGVEPIYPADTSGIRGRGVGLSVKPAAPLYGMRPSRRAADTASSRLCADSLAIAFCK